MFPAPVQGYQRVQVSSVLWWALCLFLSLQTVIFRVFLGVRLKTLSGFPVCLPCLHVLRSLERSTALSQRGGVGSVWQTSQRQSLDGEGSVYQTSHLRSPLALVFHISEVCSEQHCTEGEEPTIPQCCLWAPVAAPRTLVPLSGNLWLQASVPLVVLQTHQGSNFFGKDDLVRWRGKKMHKHHD